MNRSAAVLACLVAGSSVTGCGGGSIASYSVGPGGGTANLPQPNGTPSRDPLSPAPGLPGAHPATAWPTTEPAGLHQTVTPIAWSYVGQRDDGRTLVLRSYVAGCQQFAGAHISETARAVTVSTYALQPTTQQICPQLAQVLTGTVRLAAPLGHRRLLHALLPDHGRLPGRQGSAPSPGRPRPGG